MFFELSSEETQLDEVRVTAAITANSKTRIVLILMQMFTRVWKRTLSFLYHDFQIRTTFALRRIVEDHSLKKIRNFISLIVFELFSDYHDKKYKIFDECGGDSG